MPSASRSIVPSVGFSSLALLAILAGAATLLPGRFAAGESVLKAGAAKVDITPAEPVHLAGYASRKDPSRGVHDPLSARAVAFERDGRRLVLVSTDLIGFYGGTAEPLRNAILEGCGLEPEALFLSAIHTHSAPSLTLDEAGGNPSNVVYTKALREKLVGLVRSALANMEPARIFRASGSAPVGANRREVVREESGEARIVLGRNPEVLTDREVQVLKVARASDRSAIAVLFAYATHSTSLGPANYLVSGDVHGLAEQFLEGYLEGGVIAAGFAGASGDIDPWFRVLPGFQTARGWIPEPILLGTMLGEEVAAALEKSRELPDDGPIRSRIATLELPGKPGGEGSPGSESPRVPLTVTVARIGSAAFVGLGCEAFDEIGRAIKAASPFSPTFVITHCNGASGYLAPERCYPEGGYEIQSTRFAPSAAKIVIAEVARLLAEIRAAEQGGDPDGKRNLAPKSDLPRGAGFAAKFEADRGISKHPAVIFADDFEAEDFLEKWDDSRGAKGDVLDLVDCSAESPLLGKRSLRVTATLGKNTGGGLTKWFEPAPAVYIRFYVKFDPSCDYIHHFVTLRANKGLRGGDRWSGFGGAGVKPQGHERFSTALEPWGNWGRWPPPGRWNFYSYWHEMARSPDGKYWGNAFRPAEAPDIRRGVWICAEFLLRENTPGKPDGEQAFWIDGELVGHWKGISWRKSEGLRANALTLESYVTENWTKNPRNVVYFDNLVIAREYIGPAGPPRS